LEKKSLGSGVKTRDGRVTRTTHIFLFGLMNSKTFISLTCLLQVCTNGHVSHRWCSQPLLNRCMHAGDLLLASSILISGNNFQKISTLAKFLKLPILSSSTYHRIQRTYLVPSIDSFWLSQQDDVIRGFQNRDVIVMGK
jgi:hypothetical protein